MDDLSETEATLAKVQSKDVKVMVPFGLIRLDFDGNGKATEGGALAAVCPPNGIPWRNGSDQYKNLGGPGPKLRDRI